MADLIYMRVLEGFPDALYSRVSYAAGYSKRALVTTTHDRDDIVLIDKYNNIYKNQPEELAILNQLNLGPKPENVRIVDFQHGLPWQQNLESNKEIINWLRHKNLSAMHIYTGKSTICHALAEELGIPIQAADVNTATWAESKQTIQQLNEKYHYSPRGFVCRDNNEIMEHWHQLNKLANFNGLAVVKASHCASGVISSVVSNTEELESFLAKFNYAELDGAVIEEWLESDTHSPSINFDVSVHGEIKEAFISDQFFEDNVIAYGEEGTRIYRGNQFPSTFSQDIQNTIREKALVYLKDLINYGYWGPVGFDAIVLKKPHNGQKVLITEINPRLTGPRFGFDPMVALGAGAFRLQNQICDKRINAEKLREILTPILYNPERKEGYIFFNFFPGKFIALLLAPNEKRLNEIVHEAKQYNILIKPKANP